MISEIVERIRQRIQDSEKVLLSAHIRPDGDAIGAMVGLAESLVGFGKQVDMVMTDGFSKELSFIPGTKKIRSKVGEFDLSILLDCSDVQRAGCSLGPDRQWDINIDHHATSEPFARLNWIEPRAVGTCEMLANALISWKAPINQPCAEALLTGILTDTIGFRTNSMSPEALETSAKLMRLGADLPKLYKQALNEVTLEAVRMWGLGLVKLETFDRMVITNLSEADRKICTYPGNDDADLINLLVNIRDTDIHIVLVEQPGRMVKVSWRAIPGIDVSKIAQSFGGGGHTGAAGATISGSIDDVKELVIKRSLMEMGK
jgi:phosphoesterase RecJ-like protein